MKRELSVAPELEALPSKSTGDRGDGRPNQVPQVLNVAELLSLQVSAPEMQIEEFLPASGASLMFGAPKSGKTVLAVQVALAIATGAPLLGRHRILKSGGALIVEQDDPAGTASVKDILLHSRVSVEGVPFYFVPRVPFTFGIQLLEWLEDQIVSRELRLVVLDSYTALRGPRGSRVDIVKAEQSDLNLLDALAKRTGCCIIVVHHDSKGSAALDWSQKAAGTFAMTASTEAQIHISRFGELDSNAKERLVRIRGRHLEGLELVLRFRKESMDYDHVLEGGAAPFYPLVLQLQTNFGTQSFGPRELSLLTGVSRATAGRLINRLYQSGALNKSSFGQYRLTMGGERERTER